MNRYFFVRIESRRLMNGGFPTSWFIPAITCSGFHLRSHRGRAGVVYVRHGNGCVEVVAHHPLREGPFVAFGKNEDKVQLVFLAYRVASMAGSTLES